MALCELAYYHQWYNIRDVGRVSNEHTAGLVPDGYYNARELDEEVFKPLGAKYTLIRIPTINNEERPNYDE